MSKKLHLLPILLLGLWAFTACQKTSLDTCDLVDPLSEATWLQELYAAQVHGEEMSFATYPAAYQVQKNGRKFFILSYFSGQMWCGTGLLPNDIYRGFTCEGEPVKLPRSWEELTSLLESGKQIWNHYEEEEVPASEHDS